MTEAKLRRLENPAADPVDVSDLILEAAGRPPALQIDITDPPSPIVGRVGELAVQAATADQATRALGRELARAIRDAARGEG